MRKTDLTQAKVDALKPRDKRYTLSDIKGLQLLVMPSGRITYVHRTSAGYRDREAIIGVHPAMTLAQARHRVLTGLAAPGEGPTAPTLRALIDRYVTTDAAHLVSVKRRGAVLRDMLAPLMDQPAIEMSRPFLIKACQDRLKAGMKGSSVHGYRTICTMFAHWLVDKGLLDKSPFTRLPRIPRERTIKFLDQNGLVAMERACAKLGDLPMATFAMLCLHAGLRSCEAQTLEWSAISFEKRRITIMSALSKTRQGRDVGMSDRLISFLRKVRDQLPAKAPFKVGNLYPRFAKLKIAAGIDHPLTPHSLRHSYATAMISRNVAPNIVQRNLGHASLHTTSIYVHATDTQAIDSARAMDLPMGKGFFDKK